MYYFEATINPSNTSNFIVILGIVMCEMHVLGQLIRSDFTNCFMFFFAQNRDSLPFIYTGVRVISICKRNGKFQPVLEI